MRKMNDPQRGPSRGLIDTIRRVFTALTGTLHTRLELVAVELEEEKSRITHLLIMVGLTLVFTAFGIISLLVFILLLASPEHRLMVLGGASAVFIVLALASSIFIRQIISRSSILPETRRQLSKDLSILKGDEA
ncbi:phage holin family protein [Serratia marcescens]|nr:phage holin family protein [Serratia marcescens]MBN5208102.1 phage holin family protein [Serratia marcescens]